MISPSPSPFSPHYTRVTCLSQTLRLFLFSPISFAYHQFNRTLTFPPPSLYPILLLSRLAADAKRPSFPLPTILRPPDLLYFPWLPTSCLRFCSLPPVPACLIRFWNTTKRDGYTRESHFARLLNRVQHNVIRPLVQDYQSTDP